MSSSSVKWGWLWLLAAGIFFVILASDAYALRRPIPAKHGKFWVCPERPDGTPVIRRCFIAHWP